MMLNLFSTIIINCNNQRINLLRKSKSLLNEKIQPMLNFIINVKNIMGVKFSSI